MSSNSDDRAAPRAAAALVADAPAAQASLARCAPSWPLRALQDALAEAWPGAVVECVAEIDSTNRALVQRAHAGLAAPLLLAAGVQTAGRGRRGRRWSSPAGGAALTFSLALPLAPREWSGLSLAVGLALAQSLHPAIRIKWPNDLWWHERKLAGILIETVAAADGQQRCAVIGIGINVAQPPAGNYAPPPAWACEWAPDATPPGLLLQILPELTRTLQVFERSGFAPFRRGFAARDALAGRPVRLSDGTAGTACGIANDGALMLRTGAGVRAIRSAEVSVRPLGATAGEWR